ncbi:MAG: NAD(P)/FAD-dependent oxidoreductase, partial [Haliea sp.]
MAHIVVMGAGIAGMPAAYELRELLPDAHRITVVSATDYFQFVPSNPWVAVGWRDRKAITVPAGPCLVRKGIAFVPHAVTAIDAASSTLALDGGEQIAYDYLVIATGPRLSFDEVPGAGPDGG